MTQRNLFKNPAGLHEKIAADIPQIARGLVWCKECGREQKVNGANCLRSGWPECCGYTMTIDHPSTWSTPLARKSDPETSHEAAAKIAPKLSDLQQRVMEAYRVLGPMTAKQCEQLDQFYTCSPSTVRKRVSELERKGLLTYTGSKVDGCREFRA